MKRIFLQFLIAASLLSCSKEQSIVHPLIGRWIETQVYADPGNGSGTWQQSPGDHFIIFNDNSTFQNQSYLNTDLLERFQIKDDSSIYFLPSGMTQIIRVVKFTLTGDNNVLELTPQCIEGCGYKYVRASALLY